MRTTRPSFISGPLLPAAAHGERSLARDSRLRLADLFPLPLVHVRCPPWQPELALVSYCAFRSSRWSAPATPPAAWPPEHGTPQPEPRAASARTPKFAPPRQQYRLSTSQSHLRSCFGALRARGPEAYVR